MSGIFELALIIGLAAILGIVARLFRQPAILAYLATGAIIGYFGILPVVGSETYRIFADLGIMFLLFLVGLEVNFSSLKLVGRTSLTIGLGQIIFTAFFGFLIAGAFGFSVLSAAYIAAALTFSSTIIIVKLLSEKRDLNSLYGKIAIGIMLVQDFVAIFILIALSGIDAGGAVLSPIVLMLAKGAALLAIMIFLGRRILPHVFDSVARSPELLFIVSLAWVFAVAALVERFGFSIEIGGFLAGIALANSAENFQIVSRVKSLRDFFLLLFFVLLGSSLVAFDLGGLFLPVAILSLFVLIGNPLIVLIIMGLLGYRRRTSFLVGTTVAQISEFSLILVALGERLGHIDESVVALVTAVGVITIISSTYLVVYGERIARRLYRPLKIFERAVPKENGLPDQMLKKPMVLVGIGRMGESILRELPASEVLVIDFDPNVLARLRRSGHPALQGDISDDELWDKIDLADAQLVISTSPDAEDNSGLIERLNIAGFTGKKIVRAETVAESEMLYTRGADYVIFPHVSTGHFLGRRIAEDMTGGFLAALRTDEWNFFEKR